MRIALLVRQTCRYIYSSYTCTVHPNIEYPVLAVRPEQDIDSCIESLPLTPANTSRHRSHLAALVQSTPRQSHLNQIRGIFAKSASLRALAQDAPHSLESLRAEVVCTLARAQDVGAEVASVSVASKPRLDEPGEVDEHARLRVDQAGIAVRLPPQYTPTEENANRTTPDTPLVLKLPPRDRSPNESKICELRRSTSTEEVSMTVSKIEEEGSDSLEHEPLTPLEREISRAFKTQSPKDSQRRKTLHIKHPERVTAESGCDPFEDDREAYSTDSWSGDEIFFKAPADSKSSVRKRLKQRATDLAIHASRSPLRPSRFHKSPPVRTMESTTPGLGQYSVPHECPNGHSNHESHGHEDAGEPYREVAFVVLF